MNKPKISVLVPCYNNAIWMRGCLQSIADQTLTDIEVLLADDGSTDPEAIAIIDEFVAKDSRFKLDRHENIGCGKSLNRLFDMATGEYIAEIDGDDQFYPDAMEKLWKLTKNGTVDYVKGSYDALIPEKIVSVDMWPNELIGTVFNPMQLTPELKMQFFGSTPSLWCGIYRREWMKQNNIRWQPTDGALYQDTSVSLLLKLLAKTANVTNEKVYKYNLCNDDCSTKREGNFLALCNEYDAVERVLKSNGINVWDIFARIRFSGMMWMLPRVKQEDVPGCLAKLKADMGKEYINPALFDAEDMKVFNEWYGTGLC